MFHFTIRNILCLAILTAFASGCESDSRVRTLRTGARNVEEHAKEIERAAKADNRPPSEE